MTLRQTTQTLIAEVEDLSGYPVEVVVNATASAPAALRMARGATALHTITIQSEQAGAADYHVCVQCGFILRFFSGPPESRMDLTGSEVGQKAMAEQLARMSRDGLLAALPAPQVAMFVDRLLMGLGMQLRSMPVELRINAWLADSYPDLREAQAVMVRRQLQENAKALGTRSAVPSKVYGASIAMNAATALYWAGVLQDDALVTPYRQAGYLLDGRGLLKTWHTLPSAPEADHDLIERWATALNVRRWFQWVPYAAPHREASKLAGGQV